MSHSTPAMLLAVALTTCGLGQEPPAAANVDGQAVSERDLQRELTRLIGDRDISDDDRNALRRRVREQLAAQEIVLAWLADTSQAASPADVDQALAALKQRVESRDISWQQYLRDHDLSEADLRRKLRWQLSWSRYLDRYLTDENLARFFQRHRRDFDGTRLRVRHILLRLQPDADSSQAARREQQANRILQQVRQGELDFVSAAQQFSDAPTSDRGGDLGWIERHQPMPETFSLAAFQLQVDEISPPIRSPFGIHLIQVQEIEPGQATWQDVRDELETAAAKYLFDWIVKQQEAD